METDTTTYVEDEQGFASPVDPDTSTSEATGDASGTAEPSSRRGRGDLEHDVKLVCDDFVSGSFALKENEQLTPHRIGKRIKEADALDKAPSTGAISNVLDRWEEYGFATLTDTKPKAFESYTDEARTTGLAALKQRTSEAKRAAKAAAKAAEKAADSQ